MEKYQTILPRLLALIIDSLIFLPFAYLDQIAGIEDKPLFMQYLLVFMITISGPAYSIFMHGRFGQTLGKMAAKVKVLDINENPISYSHAFFRDLPGLFFNLCAVAIYPANFLTPEGQFNFEADYVAGTIFLAMMAWGFADMFSVFFNDQRRALHDYIAGTVVVNLKVEKEPLQ